MAASRTYPSDVTEEEWTSVAPHLALLREEAPQRKRPWQALFTAVR